MLSFMNEVDSYLLLPLYVLYKIQNQIFQQWQLWVLHYVECNFVQFGLNST